MIDLRGEKSILRLMSGADCEEKSTLAPLTETLGLSDNRAEGMEAGNNGVTKHTSTSPFKILYKF